MGRMLSFYRLKHSKLGQISQNEPLKEEIMFALAQPISGFYGIFWALIKMILLIVNTALKKKKHKKKTHLHLLNRITKVLWEYLTLSSQEDDNLTADLRFSMLSGCRFVYSCISFLQLFVSPASQLMAPFRNTLWEVVPHAVTHKQRFACITQLGWRDIIKNDKNTVFCCFFCSSPALAQ